MQIAFFGLSIRSCHMNVEKWEGGLKESVKAAFILCELMGHHVWLNKSEVRVKSCWMVDVNPKENNKRF